MINRNKESEAITANLKDTQVYKEDGRVPIDKLYSQYERLVTEHGWTKEIVYSVKTETPNGPIEVYAYAYLSQMKGSALWVNAGVHGEEPSGPIALGRNVDKLGELGNKLPIVVIPLLNPVGYSKGWRYFNEYRDWHKGTSVSDSDHYLPDLGDPAKPRAEHPSSEIAARVTKFVIDLMEEYPPLLIIDHHEDEALPESYVYSQGPKGADDPVAQKVVNIMAKIVPTQMAGVTRFGELVKNGVVVDESGKPVKDGSIDELYASSRIYSNGQWIKKPASKTSLVIETPTIGIDLEKRIKAHTAIINQYEDLFSLAITSAFPPFLVK